MKTKMMKFLCAVLAASAIAMSFAGCGGDTKTPDSSGGSAVTDQQPKQLTEEEYLAKVEDLGTQMTEISTEAQKKIAEAGNDVEALKKIISDMKAPFTEFAGLAAPDKYADAQSKFKSGCEAMNAYLDTLVEIMDLGENPDPAKAQELATKMQEQITKAMTDIQDGTVAVTNAQ